MAPNAIPPTSAATSAPEIHYEPALNLRETDSWGRIATDPRTASYYEWLVDVEPRRLADESQITLPRFAQTIHS